MNQKMRIWHRYLGFYLVGVMAVYAVSGTILIFRRTDTFKKEQVTEKQFEKGLTAEELPQKLKIKDLEITDNQAQLIVFKGGTYNKNTGVVFERKMIYPYLLDKLIHLHKATTNSPAYWMNILFGASLLFFVISSFWMFLPHTDVFKKGVYFSLAGVIMTIVLLLL